MAPRFHDAADALVDATLERLGSRIVLGTPLGLGKSVEIVNAFYRRAESQSSIELSLYTALTLEPPRGDSELERRLIEPLARRLFSDVPDPAWAGPVRNDDLPSNIQVREFYFQPGSRLGSSGAQQSHLSSNYTHVVRDVLDAGINVFVQRVAADPTGERSTYSLSSNPDLTLDLLPRLQERRQWGEDVAILAEIDCRMPFLYGDAEIEQEAFDEVLDRRDDPAGLFGTPNEPIDLVDSAIAVHVSTLVRDGGTLQVGIGSLGDAICSLLELRHEENDIYRKLVGAAGTLDGHEELIEEVGGLGPFDRGLFACSEMFVDGFLELYRAGILARRVFPHRDLQRLLDRGEIDETPSLEALELLVERGALDPHPGDSAIRDLRRVGFLRPEVRLENGELTDGQVRTAANLEDPRVREEIAESFLGDRLLGARLAHASFFLGPRRFYRELAEMPSPQRELFEMTRISWVNELYGDEELKRVQRRQARFVNTAMKMTLLGAAASDGLEDGRVVSGVGGQYNLIAMAHELEDGRSILMLRSTRESGGELESNIVWSYGHVTIPRHLKDLVITEYGIADLRGRTDAEVVAALIEVADARFQKKLARRAKAAGKLPRDYRIPRGARANTPERLRGELGPFRKAGALPELPFGTELTAEELVLAKALRGLRNKVESRDLSLFPRIEDLRRLVDIPEESRPYLERMGLADPDGAEEELLQRAVVYALSIQDLI